MMDPAEVKKIVNERLMIARVLWVALLFSVFVYLSLGFLLPRMGVLPEQAMSQPEFLPHILMAMGIISAFIGVLIGMGKLPIIKIEGATPEAALGKLFTSLTICWALCETAGVMGLVIFMLFRSFETLLSMCIVAIIGMVLTFPTEGKFTAALQKAGSDAGMMPPQ